MGSFVQMLILSGDQATAFQDPSSIESILSSYATSPQVATACQITTQKTLDDTVEGQTSFEIGFSCEFSMASGNSSAELDLASLPKAFIAFINNNLSIVHADLARYGVITVFPVQEINTTSQESLASMQDPTSMAPTSESTTPTDIEVSTQRYAFQQMYKLKSNSTTALDDIGEMLLSMHLQHYCIDALQQKTSIVDQNSVIQVNCQVSRQTSAPDSHLIVDYMCSFHGMGISTNTQVIVRDNINQNIQQFTAEMR
jgi:hypothetical protein